MASAPLGLALTAAFAVLGLLHLYWAIGGRTERVAAIPEVEGTRVFTPSPLGTFAVALALLTCAWLVAGLSGWISMPISRAAARWSAFATALLFLARAIGDFRLVGFFKRVRDSAFARQDTVLFSPLCLVLAAGLFAVGSSGGRPTAPPSAAADTPEAIVQSFYQSLLELHPVGLPTPQEQARLGTRLTPGLLRLLDESRAYREDFARAHPGDKPPWTDGNLFASLFEGPKDFEVVDSRPMPDGNTLVIVRLWYSPDAEWQDSVVVARTAHGHAIHEIVFSGAGPFNRPGRLSERLRAREK